MLRIFGGRPHGDKSPAAHSKAVMRYASDARDRLTTLAMLHFNCKQPATELAQQDLGNFNALVAAIAAIAAGHTGAPALAPAGKLGGAAPPKPSPAAASNAVSS